MSSPDQDEAKPSSGVPLFLCFVVVLVVGATAFFTGRSRPDDREIRSSSAKPVTADKRGAELARTLCASCHLEPAPAVSTRDRWALEILPAKADLLGFGAATNATVISSRDWSAVCNHYLAQAPNAFPETKEREHPTSERFKAVVMNHPTATRMTMGRIDPTGGVIYVGNADDRSIDVIAPDGRLLTARPMPQIPLAAAPTDDGIFVALGSLDEESEGGVVFVGKPGSGNPELQVLAEGLARPVDLAVGNLDQDGRREVMVATADGLLLLQEGRPIALATNASYRAVVIADLNEDHRADVLAIRSGQQILEAHLSQGGGSFTTTNYVQQHPAWHFSDLAVSPLKRGEPIRIITSNGNDGRIRRHVLPRIPDHGVFVWAPGKSGKKRLAALQNAHRMVARDFDGDEDLDIVAIGYSGDHRVAADHGAVYLEQQRDRSFRVYRLPQSADARWSDVDAGDVDQDGDPDIVITAFHPGAGNAPEARLKQWDQSPTTCLLLLNQTIP